MLLSVVFGLLLAIVGFVCRGFVFSVLWGWFVAPITGFPFINIAQGVGIVFVGRLVVNGPIFGDIDDEKFLVDIVLSGICVPAVFLALGWCLLWFV